jgi:2-oxoglutarate ferredoxin oxidoreductase subunit beta
VIEIMVNCIIYNTDNHSQLSNKEFRAEHTIFLRHGEKMLFGKDREKGLVLDGLQLKAVTIDQDGYTLDDILVHDATEKNMTLHHLLSMMSGDLPLAMGIIRDVEALVYDESIHQQIEEVKAQKPARTLREVLISGESWEIK